MKKSLLIAADLGVMIACKKDGSGTKPVISFNSYSSDYLLFSDSATNTSQQPITVSLNISDGDGDIEDTIAILSHTNANGPAADYVYAQMPDIGANKGHSVSGQVSIRLEATDIVDINPTAKPDSIWFTAFVKDNAHHSSDTIATPKIPIIKQ